MWVLCQGPGEVIGFQEKTIMIKHGQFIYSVSQPNLVNLEIADIERKENSAVEGCRPKENGNDRLEKDDNNSSDEDEIDNQNPPSQEVLKETSNTSDSCLSPSIPPDTERTKSHTCRKLFKKSIYLP